MLEQILLIVALLSSLFVIGYVVARIQYGYLYVLGFIVFGLAVTAVIAIPLFVYLCAGNINYALFAYLLSVGFPFAFLGAVTALLVSLNSYRTR